jgi:hypothetical protein
VRDCECLIGRWWWWWWEGPHIWLCRPQRNPVIQVVGAPTTVVPHPAGVGLYGTKAGMTQIFKDGLSYPATVIALEDGNVVTQVKTVETDGYNAVQVGYQTVREDKVKKPVMGHLKKAGAPPMRRMREYKVRQGNYSGRIGA